MVEGYGPSFESDPAENRQPGIPPEQAHHVSIVHNAQMAALFPKQECEVLRVGSVCGIWIP